MGAEPLRDDLFAAKLAGVANTVPPSPMLAENDAGCRTLTTAFHR